MPDKWYVNLEPNGKNKNRGKTIPFTAKRTKSSFQMLRFNKKVRWTVELDLNGFEKERIKPGDLHEETQDMEERNKEWVNKIKLAPVTNLIYTINARKIQGSTKNFEFQEKKYKTFRKVYYDVRYMNDRCLDVYNAVKNDFLKTWEKIGFEFEECKPATKIESQPHTSTSERFGINDSSRMHFVFVNNLGPIIHLRAAWQMNNKTQPKENDSAKISLENNVVSYEVPSELLETGSTGKVSEVVEHKITDPEDSAIELIDNHTVAIKLANAENICAAIKKKQEITIKAKLKGYRIESEEFKKVYDYAKIDDPVKLGSATLKITADNKETPKKLELTIQDETRTWTASPVASGHLKVANYDKVLLDNENVTRIDDHTLKLEIEKNFKKEEIHPSLKLDLSIELYSKGEERTKTIAGKAGAHVKIKDEEDPKKARIEIKDEYMVLNAKPLLASELEPVVLRAANWITIPESAFKIKNNKVEIDLADDGFENTPIKEAFEKGDFLGFEMNLRRTQYIWGGNINDKTSLSIISTRAKDNKGFEDIKEDVLKVMLHETGHAHGLVQDETEYPGSKNNSRPKKNDKRYTGEYGGQGNHCNHNAKLVPSNSSHEQSPTTSEKIYVKDKKELCVMYHSVTFGGGSEFCDTCKGHLREKAMRKFT